jgi:hypothetical protein
VGEGGRLERCGACGGRAFWLKENFRSEYGCLILIVAAVFMDATYQLSLPAAVLLDFVLYQFLGDVAVCYRCKAEVRGTPRNPAHRAFDLQHATDLDKEIHRQGGAKATIDWSKGAAAQPSLTRTCGPDRHDRRDCAMMSASLLAISLAWGISSPRPQIPFAPPTEQPTNLWLSPAADRGSDRRTLQPARGVRLGVARRREP